MNCIIVDDEAAAIKILEIYVEQTPGVTNMGSFSSSLEALEFVKNNDVDLILLDINMPHLSGLAFLELLKGKCKVILTTAYSEYALDGYKYDVVDYLTKPIALEDFLKAIQKAADRGNPAKAVEKDSLNDFIMVKTDHKGKFAKIPFSDILYIESMKNYVAIYTKDREQIITLLTMKELEERLPKEHFFRIHKSYILALSQIKVIDGGEVVLQNSKDRVPLGVTYREAFFNLLEANMMKQ